MMRPGSDLDPESPVNDQAGEILVLLSFRTAYGTGWSMRAGSTPAGADLPGMGTGRNLLQYEKRARKCVLVREIRRGKHMRTSTGGRRSDYLIASVKPETEICGNCKSRFKIMDHSRYSYAISGFGNRKYFCSWKCLTAWKRKQAEKEKTMKRTAVKPYEKKGKKQTLEEWARELNVPYFQFWEKVRISKIQIYDAADIVSGQK